MDAREDRVRVDARAAATGVGRCVAAVAVPVRLQEAEDVVGLRRVGGRGGADGGGEGGTEAEGGVLLGGREERGGANLLPEVEAGEGVSQVRYDVSEYPYPVWFQYETT